MSKNIKNILVIILIISISSGISVMANTLIDSKEVIYDNKKSGMESTNVQAAVDELYSAATDYSALNTEINNIKTNYNSLSNELIPKKYKTPKPVNGVTLQYGGYFEVGNLVVVDMQVAINTDVLSLSKNMAVPTEILKNFPESAARVSHLNCHYGTFDNSGNPIFVSTIGYFIDGTLSVSDVSTNSYVSGFNFVISGVYLKK